MSCRYLRREYATDPDDFIHRLFVVLTRRDYHCLEATPPRLLEIVKDRRPPTRAERGLVCAVASEWVTECEFERAQLEALRQNSAGLAPGG